MPRREIRHEPEGTTCACGGILKRIAEDVAYKLDYQWGMFSVERQVRGKWVCTKCEVAEQPASRFGELVPYRWQPNRSALMEEPSSNATTTCLQNSCRRDMSHVANSLDGDEQAGSAHMRDDALPLMHGS